MDMSVLRRSRGVVCSIAKRRLRAGICVVVCKNNRELKKWGVRRVISAECQHWHKT